MAGKPIDIEIADSFGNTIEFKTTSQLKRFLQNEREAWDWVSEARRPTVDMTTQFLPMFDTLANYVQRFEEGSMSEDDLRNNVRGAFAGETPNLLISDQEPGATIGRILGAYDAKAAVEALIFLTGKRQPNLLSQSDFKVWQLLANPRLIEAGGWLDDQKRQIANSRQALRREIDKYGHAVEEIEETTRAIRSREVERYRRSAVRAFKLANRRAARISDETQSQIAAMEAVRAAYAEQMRLKAPVRYWALKKRIHSTSAVRWGAGLVIYVIVAVIAGTVAVSNVWTAIDTGEALSGRHFLLVVSIGALLTVLFWMARLIVRIYLGERHLYTDAEERRIMTQAYLALIKESAASDQERVVILSALFRAAQDGIVKDDGAGDISLPAMVARLLDAKR